MDDDGGDPPAQAPRPLDPAVVLLVQEGPPTPRRTIVKRYRLDARRFSGPLCAPTRNDSEAHEADDWSAVRETARGLLARGFTVWIYERIPRAEEPVTCDRRPREVWDLRLIDQRRPAAAAASPP